MGRRFGSLVGRHSMATRSEERRLHLDGRSRKKNLGSQGAGATRTIMERLPRGRVDDAMGKIKQSKCAMRLGLRRQLSGSGAEVFAPTLQPFGALLRTAARQDDPHQEIPMMQTSARCSSAVPRPSRNRGSDGMVLVVATCRAHSRAEGRCGARGSRGGSRTDQNPVTAIRFVPNAFAPIQTQCRPTSIWSKSARDVVGGWTRGGDRRSFRSSRACRRRGRSPRICTRS